MVRPRPRDSLLGGVVMESFFCLVGVAFVHSFPVGPSLHRRQRTNSHPRQLQQLYGHLAKPNNDPYVPSGLTQEAYLAIKLQEEEHLKTMNFGHFGPRFQKSEIPDGDWMLMPNLWTHGAVDSSPNISSAMESSTDEQILLFLEQHQQQEQSSDAPLYILSPVVQEDSFLQRAWEEGHHVTLLGLVPSAAIAMRSWFGGGGDLSSEQWKEAEDDRDDGMIVWHHDSGRATIVVGDVVSTDLTELHGWCNVIYDHGGLEALVPDSRELLTERLCNYLEEDGIVFTESSQDVVMDIPKDGRKLMLVTKVPSATEDGDENYTNGLGVELALRDADTNTSTGAECCWVMETIERGGPVDQTGVLVEGMVLHKVNRVALAGHSSRDIVHNVLQEEAARNDDCTTILAEIPALALPHDGNQVIEMLEEDETTINEDGVEQQFRILSVQVEKTAIHHKLGIRLSEDDGIFTVRSLSSDSPFHGTPLKPGMEICSINGIPIRGRDMAFCGEILGGYAGTVLVDTVVPLVEDGMEDPKEEETAMKDSIDEAARTVEEEQVHVAEMESPEEENAFDEEIVFGKEYEYISTLGGIQRDGTDSLPQLLEIGHLLKFR